MHPLQGHQLICNYMQILNNFQVMRAKGIILNEEEWILYNSASRLLSDTAKRANDLPKSDRGENEKTETSHENGPSD